MRNNKALRVLSFMIAFTLVFNFGGSYTISADAASGTQIKITKDKQVVDTFKNVPAYYRPGGGDGADETYGCYAYVVRYYQTIYGKTVYNLFHKCIPLTYGDTFKEVAKPKVGDICAQIKTNSNHWSIVRKVSGSTVTVIDQNNKWVIGDETFAYKNYQYDISEVTFYRLSSVIAGTATTAKKATTEASEVKKTTTTEKVTTTEKATTTTECSTEKPSSMSVGTGIKKKITKSVVPALSKTTALKWKSSKKKVAKVDKSGYVTGVKKGTAYVTGTLSSGKTVKVKVKVKKAGKLTLRSEDVTFPHNYSWQLTCTEKNVKLTYESSDKSIATVNKKGVVTSKSKRGIAIITVTSSNNKINSCIIRVN